MDRVISNENKEVEGELEVFREEVLNCAGEVSGIRKMRSEPMMKLDCW